MTEQTERPIKELRLLLMLTDPKTASSFGYAEFSFPLMLFEDKNFAPLLIPEPACEQLVQNWAEMLPRLETESAQVDIPYHPAIEQDENTYLFNVMIAYLDADTPAFGEMLMLEKYAPRLWERYRHLAHDFSFFEDSDE